MHAAPSTFSQLLHEAGVEGSADVERAVVDVRDAASDAAARGVRVESRAHRQVPCELLHTQPLETTERDGCIAGHDMSGMDGV